MFGRLQILTALVLTAALLALAVPAPPVWAQAGVEARLASLENRLAALEQRLTPAAAATPIAQVMDQHVQVLLQIQTIRAIQGAWQEPAPKTFWQAVGADASAGFVFILLALAAIGSGSVAFAF